MCFLLMPLLIPCHALPSNQTCLCTYTHLNWITKKVCKDDSSIKIEFSCETVLLCNFPPDDCVRIWNSVICFAVAVVAVAVVAVCSWAGALCSATKVSMSPNARKMYTKSSSIEKLRLIRKSPILWHDFCVHVFDFASVVHCFICDPFLRIVINFARHKNSTDEIIAC